MVFIIPQINCNTPDNNSQESKYGRHYRNMVTNGLTCCAFTVVDYIGLLQFMAVAFTATVIAYLKAALGSAFMI